MTPVCIRRGNLVMDTHTHTRAHTEGSYEETQRRWPSTNQEERLGTDLPSQLSKGANLLTP